MGNRFWLWIIAAMLGALGVLIMPREREKEYAIPPAMEQTTATQATEATISLPYGLEKWNMTIESLVDYEGPYIEDGSGEPVSNVAGLVLHNTGDRGISLAVLAVEQGSKVTYFSVSWLPPGDRVLVLAMGQAPYIAEPVTGCRVLGIRWADFASTPLAVQNSPNGGLEVTNQSPELLEGARVRYKWYMEEYGMYFGGITHSVSLPPLRPGENCLVYPENYGPETSRVVAAIK